MDISIVIPAYNESRKIAMDIESAAAFLAKAGFKGEIIIVDDGSTDGTAEAAQLARLPSSVGLLIRRLERNRGKGYAVKTGVLASGGDAVLFADSGTCIPYADALGVLDRILAGKVDIAMASRRLKDTVIVRNRPFGRRILSRLFHLAAVWVAGLPAWISDSQCGFKIYKGELARMFFTKKKTTGYMFELEIILHAVREGCTIEEFAVHWSCDFDTRLHPFADAAAVWKELLQVRRMFKKKPSL